MRSGWYPLVNVGASDDVVSLDSLFRLGITRPLMVCE